MTANGGVMQTAREYAASIAEESGWGVVSDGLTDTYIWPGTLKVAGYPPIYLNPNTVGWDETGVWLLEMDGVPLTPDETKRFSQLDAVAYIFGDMFGDPFGVNRFGEEQVREWIEAGKGSYRLAAE